MSTTISEDERNARADRLLELQAVDKKRKGRVEFAGAVIIGIAALLTALATFLGAKADGDVQERSDAAVGLTVAANDAYNDANASRSEERDWFFGYVTALASDQEATADLLGRAMPGEVGDLTDEWFALNEDKLFADGELIDDPFSPDDGEYASFAALPSVVNLELGNSRLLDSQCALFDSQVAAVKGDNYGLSTVFLAIALVVGGIAALLNGKYAQIIVLVTATISLALGAGVLTLGNDEAEARSKAAEKLFATDDEGQPRSSTESLAYVDTSCGPASTST